MHMRVVRQLLVLYSYRELDLACNQLKKSSPESFTSQIIASQASNIFCGPKVP